jgi:uncharacterized membrane protein
MAPSDLYRPRSRTLSLRVIVSWFLVVSSFSQATAFLIEPQSRVIATPVPNIHRRYLPYRRTRDQLSGSEKLQWLPKSRPQRDARRGDLLQTSALPAAASFFQSGTAVSALVLSTVTGRAFDRKILPNSGILVTLAASAILSNTGLAPASHVVYDLCWSTLLPASLALLLLSLSTSTATASSSATDVTTEKHDRQTKDPNPNSAARVVRDLALPFGLASLGSIAGCLLSFFICRAFPGVWQLSGPEAAQAAACLVASLIGGSINFFATAAVLAGTTTTAASTTSTLVSSMAAADLVVMALYFAFLDWALYSPRLQRLFGRGGQKHVEEEEESKQTVQIDLESNYAGTSKPMDSPTTTTTAQRRVSLFQKTRAIVLVSGLALAIVQVAVRVERAVSNIIPGTACAVIAVLTPVIQRFLPSQNQLVTEMKEVAAPLAEWCFLCLFASIGMSANLGQALRSGPSCLLFSLTALMVHVVIVFSGSLRIGSRLEDVLVASNAAVGGPATAAAFSGRIPKSPRSNGLFMAATVWGVVGYAVGTTIGVTMYRALQAFV